MGSQRPTHAHAIYMVAGQMIHWLSNTAISFALQAPFLVALGLYFDVFRRQNFSLGGAYATALCILVAGLAANFPSWLVVTIAGASVFALLIAFELVVFEPLARSGRTADEILIASLGANIVMEQALSMAFGDNIKFPGRATTDLFARWLISQPPQTSTLPIAVVILALVAFLILGTEIGSRLIALGENSLLFRTLGIRPTAWKIYTLFILTSVLTLSAVGAVNVTGAFPQAGFSLVILGFLTRLLGGPVHQFKFIVTAAAVVIFDQAISSILHGEWRKVVLFSTLFIVLSAPPFSKRSMR